MENLLYVLGAALFSTVVGVIIAVRNRKPTSMEGSIDSFSRELKALAPDRPDRPARASAPAVDQRGDAAG